MPRGTGEKQARGDVWLETHAAHSAVMVVRHRGRFRFRPVGHHRFGRDQQPGDRCGVLQRHPYDLGRVDDAGTDHVLVVARLRVIAVVGVALFGQLADHDRTIGPGILGNLPGRRLKRLAHDLDTELLVVVGRGQTIEHLGRIEQRDAAAGDDAFLDRGLGRVHRVIDAVLALLDLDLAAAADADHRDAAGQLGQPLLQLLLVVIGGRLLDLRLDLGDPGIDRVLATGAVNDRRILLFDAHALGAPEHVEGDVFELDAEVFRDDLTAGHNREVLEHGLAPIAEAGRLDRGHLEAAAQLVDDQRGERLALDILGDDHQRSTALHHRFEDRQQRLQAGELAFVQQDVRVFELGQHLFRVGDEIGAQITAVELHAFDDVELGFERFRLLDGDDALVADLLHRLGQHAADFLVAIRRDRADLGDLVIGRDLLRALGDIGDDRRHREVDAASQVHRVHAGRDGAHTLTHQRMGEDRRGRRAVAGFGAGSVGDLLDHLGAHVLELVGELDFLGDRYPVLGDPRCAVGSFEDHVAALRPERHANRIGQSVDAAQHALARVATQANVFCSHDYCPLLFGDDAHDVGFFHNDQVFAVELDLVARPFAKQHPVAGLHIERMDLAVVAADTRPDSHDFALGRLFACGIRDQDAAGALLDFIDAADHHPVVQWPEFHDNSPSTQASPEPTGSMR